LWTKYMLEAGTFYIVISAFYGAIEPSPSYFGG
jgi:hypothetical protein